MRDDITLNLQKVFSLGTSGQWVKLGRGVLGRMMPFAMVVVIFEAVAALLLAVAAPNHLVGFVYTALAIDLAMFVGGFLWAHLHPVEAASEGKEIADIRHAEATATKAMGALPPGPNLPDPRALAAPPTIGQITAEGHATMPETPALPPPKITQRRGRKGE